MSMNSISAKRDLAFSTMNMNLLNTKEEKENISIEEEVKETASDTSNMANETTKDEEVTYEYYLAKLEIPKIGLSRGFYDKTSSLNRLSINIKMLKESAYPDTNNGNVILAAHSGNYYNSYFGNLYKLSIGDVAYLYYKNSKYTYKITNIYNEPKDGSVIVKRNPNKNTLTLITCTKDDEAHQTIYILERV